MGASGALGGELDDEAIEIAGLVGGKFVFVLEQGPAQAFERRIGPLLGAPHLVHGLARMGDHMELVEGNRGLWQMVGDAFDEKAGDMSMQAAAMLSGAPLWARKCWTKPAMLSAPRPLLTNTTLRASASATSVR